MTDFIIPCDTVVRLSNVLANFHEDADEWFHSLRIDNGQVVATNRRIMVVENVGNNEGIFHLIVDAALLQQCRVEAPFSSKLTINVNETLRFAVAKTTLGYVHAPNCGLWSAQPRNIYDQWRNIVMQAKGTAKKSVGGMLWEADAISQIAAAAPSGRLIFEEKIDTLTRPTVVRDPDDSDWFAIFNPYLDAFGDSPAAVLPAWMTL